MEVEVNEAWVNVYDLMQIEHLEKERDNPEIQRFVQYVRRWQQALTPTPAGGAPQDPAPAAPPSGPHPPEPPGLPEPGPDSSSGASSGLLPEDRPVAPDTALAPSPRDPDPPEQLGLFSDETVRT